MRVPVSKVVLGVSLMFVGACAREATTSLSPTGIVPATAAADSAKPPSGGPSITQEHFELQFLIGSIDQHELIIQMSQACVTKAVHPELQTYCTELAASQTAAQINLRAWLQQWLGVSHAPELGGNDQKTIAKLASLTGAAFEKAFLDLMSKELDRVVRDANQCPAKAFHSELVNYCVAIPSNPSAQLQAWLCEWYSTCHGGQKTQL